MESIYAKVIRDSIAPSGYRLLTIEAQSPRFILAEINTHRRFSRNSASSRAVPIELEIQRLLDNPFIPSPFTKNQKGMAGNTPLDEADQAKARAYWLAARDKIVTTIKMLSDVKVHKQHANRLGEPFQWHKCIISSTNWDNFMWQRVNPQAQPEFHELAEAIKEAIKNSIPDELPAGAWHLPYISNEERLRYDLQILLRVSVARCARISYRKHDSERDIMEDVEMYDRLASAPHPSPFEHVAQAVHYELRSGNFVGWHQHRFDLPKWSGDDIDYEGVLLSIPEIKYLLDYAGRCEYDGVLEDQFRRILERLGLDISEEETHVETE